MNPHRSLAFCAVRRWAAAAPYIAMLLFIGPITGGLAEEPGLVIEPELVVSNTLAYSRQIKTADLDIQAAEARQKQAQAQALPKLSADGKASWYTGLKESSFGPAFTIPAIEDRYGAGVSINQPAYTGGRLTSQKQGATFQKQAARSNRETTEADLRYRALSAYWSWSKAYYGVATLNASVQRTEALSKETRDRLGAGMATESDALSTEVLLDQTRLQLAAARRGVQLALATLTLLTGRDFPSNSLPRQAAAVPEAVLADEPALIASALRHRPELEASRLDAKAAESAVKTARSEYYPQLGLTARYENARPNQMIIPPRDQWDGDGFAGITLNWSLFDWGLTRGKVKEASTRTAQAQLRRDQWQDQIVWETRQARINLVDARERVVVANRAEESARKNLESATALFKNGLLRHSEMLDANAKLTVAQNEAIATRADAILARAALEHAIGNLKGADQRPDRKP